MEVCEKMVGNWYSQLSLSLKPKKQWLKPNHVPYLLDQEYKVKFSGVHVSKRNVITTYTSSLCD